MRIVVRGIPAAQGSKRHVGRGVMVESSRAVGPWREAVRAETQRAMTDPINRPPYDGPVSMVIVFSLPRPASLPKRVRFPAKRPDLDKLLRAVLDGLTAGGAWKDDSQVIRLSAWKQFADGDGPGCVIGIDEMGES